MVELVQGAVFAIYMIGVLLIGVWASRFTKETPNSLYLAGRGLGVIVLLFTLAATIMSSFTFFGIGATARSTGLGLSGLIVIHMILFGLIFTTLGVKVHRVGDRFGYTTPAEYLRDRFENEAVPIVYVILTTLGLIGYATVQIIGGGVALNVLMDLPYVWAIVLMAIFMAVYIHISGMTGVAWSDTMQGAIMFLSLIAAFIGILVIVGPATLVSNVQDNSPELFTMVGPVGAWVPPYTVSFSIFFAIGVLAYPQIYQRFLAADSATTLKRSALLLPILGIIVQFIGIALGIWSVGIVSPENPDHTIAVLIETLTSPVISGIILAAAVAALMSSTDSVLLSLSSLIGRDIYREHINPQASERQEVRVAQGTLIVLILVSLVFAYIRPGTIFQLGALAVALHGPMVPALYFSLYWDGASAEAAVVSMIVGVAVILGLFLGYIPGQYQFGLHYGFVGFLLTVVLFVAISFVTETYAEETTEEVLYT